MGEVMKKISVFALLSALVIPAFAEEASLPEEKTLNVAAIEEATSIEQESTNPDIKFPHGLQLGVGVSATSGLNGFVGYANKSFDSFWLKRLGFRLDFATTSLMKSAINSGVDAFMGDDGIDIGDGLTIKDGSIEGHHFAALVDFYPFGDTWFLGGIRISGGYYLGNLDLSANLTGKVNDLPDSEFAFSLEGIDYTANAEWNYRGPYLGAGFDLGLFAGLKIYMDAGVVFTNKTAQLGLDLPTDNLQKWNGSTWESVSGITEFEQAKAAALADAQDELDKLKFYPMVKIGFMYRF